MYLNKIKTNLEPLIPPFLQHSSGCICRIRPPGYRCVWDEGLQTDMVQIDASCLTQQSV